MWKTQKLSDVIEKGETINPTTNPDTKFSYIDVSSVDRVSFRISETQTLLGKDAPSRARRAVKTGDVLFATIRPTLQRVAIVPEKLNGEVCSTGYIVLRPKASIICSKFIFYYMLSEKVKAEMEGLQTGASYPAVNDTQVKNLHISYPPLAEQQRIVAKLDAAFAEIDTAIAAGEKNAENTEALFEKVRNEAFKSDDKIWQHTKLNTVCDFLNGYAFKSKESIDDSDVQLLRMGNLYDNKLDLDRKPVFYPSSFSDKYSKYLIKNDDIVMTLTGTVGKRDYGYAVRVNQRSKQLLLNQRILKLSISDKSKLNEDFFLFFLRSMDFLDELYLTANGTRQANLSSDTIKGLSIPLCDISEQEQIVYKMISIQQTTNSYLNAQTRKIAQLNSLKTAFLAAELTNMSEAA